MQRNKLSVTSTASHGNELVHDQLIVGRNINYASKQNLNISFHRTVRVPDNGDINNLPPSLGTFPLYKTSDFDTIPTNIKAKSNFFLPMYQREALWISFSCNAPFAVKIYMGGTNAVSGGSRRETEPTLERRAVRMQRDEIVQDYMVTPNQLWLDGFAGADGKVRQFVAMPLGKGYTAEAQITGEEVVGGLQIEVTSSKPTLINALQSHMGWILGTGDSPVIVKLIDSQLLVLMVNNSDTIDTVKDLLATKLDLTSDQDGRTLAEFNIQAYSTLHLVGRLHGGATVQLEMGIWPGGMIKQAVVEDEYDPGSWDSDSSILFNVDILNSQVFKHYTGIDPPTTPVTAKQYAAYGIPYYAIYDEKPSRIHGDFANDKSVNDKDLEGARTLAKAKAIAEVMTDVKNPIVLLNHVGHNVGFRTRVEMENEVRECFDV
ncbi:hypothetical protein LTR78_007407 [Recurvomyces mirabilis]|uniref:Uncharacterized protein n=1 Tax=Recurvomyces mirabilis TaxID=574656 RepID=A0AAE0WJE9_9PEZI|nr:hypothetical protein LTR78_007407 [Recurvomyces mirabilis]KAK5155006.1 hypothetical protein LTS14_005961 [Recurvomyces mirabilis]